MTRTAPQPAATSAPAAGNLARRYAEVRALTNRLCETLTPEDACIQSMRDCSPTRWHLAHTSWFFETFLLKRDAAYRPYDDNYEVLFNSYYNSVGEQFPRDRRGLLSRPTLAEVLAYRRHIDDSMGDVFAAGRVDADPELTTIVEWGVQHEQQHQELILTDVKNLFSINPLLPAFRAASATTSPRGLPRGPAVAPNNPQSWQDFDSGLYSIGHTGEGFAYDNESPQHRTYLEPFRLATRLVTSGDFLAFINDGGYKRPELWLSTGWSTVAAERWSSPLYWHSVDGQWREFTLAGLRPLDEVAPVTHISYFEADAYARWAGARLPSEAEWEVAARDVPTTGNFVDVLLDAELPIHPRAAEAPSTKPSQLFGDVWEWTASPYVAYPGYQPPAGALGEYNGKFMCNQYVLRGGSCATPQAHIRATYRNFFPPEARWQFTGLRLAK